ncbi:hypothetical protein SBRY_20319 [Actinacidiphila bryophytorum]|uniref:Uncharacterized protein n=1 Tax=Actinacidiphila bryophytorum TaxID=1436133 RepID=A0A9W4E9M1_9ACTN|nr:hypothetical protein SBRY_20319 [Actinacidiphila bryophytorum]
MRPAGHGARPDGGRPRQRVYAHQPLRHPVAPLPRPARPLPPGPGGPAPRRLVAAPACDGERFSGARGTARPAQIEGREARPQQVALSRGQPGGPRDKFWP